MYKIRVWKDAEDRFRGSGCARHRGLGKEGFEVLDVCPLTTQPSANKIWTPTMLRKNGASHGMKMPAIVISLQVMERLPVAVCGE
jgi:hypothetical protein